MASASIETLGTFDEEEVAEILIQAWNGLTPRLRVVVTDKGRTVTGMIVAETGASITLRRSEEESDTVLRTEIDELVDTGVSIMPEGLEKQLNQGEMADLLAYLMSVNEYASCDTRPDMVGSLARP